MENNLPETRKGGFRFPYKIRIEPRLIEASAWVSILLNNWIDHPGITGWSDINCLGWGRSCKSIYPYRESFFRQSGCIFRYTRKSNSINAGWFGLFNCIRMKLWNIGAEGQFFIGAFAASVVVLLPVLPDNAPKWLFIIVMVVFGMIGGAIWGVIPGILKVRFNVNEIISTLMMNYIAVFWNNYFIYAVWSEGGFQMSKTFPKNAWLPRLSDFASQEKIFQGLTTHLGLVFAIIAAVVIWFILYRSKWGYEIRLIGDNAKAAKYSGIAIGKNIILVMALSGALAGLAGMSEISGVVHRLQGSISPGYGFTGIIIAWLAKLNPLAVIVVSVLFGALILAGRELQPKGIPTMIQGVIFVFLIAGDFFVHNRISISRNIEE